MKAWCGAFFFSQSVAMFSKPPGDQVCFWFLVNKTRLLKTKAEWVEVHGSTPLVEIKGFTPLRSSFVWQVSGFPQIKM